jgi:hypothetical protein
MDYILISKRPTKSFDHTLKGFVMASVVCPSFGLRWGGYHLNLMEIQRLFRFAQHFFNFHPSPLIREVVGVLMVG